MSGPFGMDPDLMDTCTDTLTALPHDRLRGIHAHLASGLDASAMAAQSAENLAWRGQVDWASAIVDAAAVRAKKGGHATGPDRGRMRGKLHVLSDAAGLPLVIAMSIIQRWRPKRSPDSTAGRAMRGTIPRRRNQVRCSAERYALSARIFRTDAGPAARRLTIRYERHGHLFNAFLVLAAAITCSEPSVAPGQADQLGETSLLWPGLHRRSAFGASRIRPRRNPPRASSRPTPHHRRRGD